MNDSPMIFEDKQDMDLMDTIESVLLGNAEYDAIGGNIQAAEVSGINVKKMILLINAYMGLLAGVAAIVFVGRTQSAHPGAATGYELTAIASTTTAAAPSFSASFAKLTEDTMDTMGMSCSRPILKMSREKPAPVMIMSAPASMDPMTRL